MKIFLLICYLGVSFSIDCLSKNSEPVDWWVILKLPLIKDQFPLGDQFYYCDSNDHCSMFEKGETLITSIDAPFLMTVSQVNQSPVKLIWNDQLFDGKTMTTHAHSKGMMAADDDGSAIIINHSLPKFPILDAEGHILLEYPNNALIYGQHIFCLSTTLIEIENLSPSYIAAQINVFQSTFPKGLIATYPNLFQLSKQVFAPLKEQDVSILETLLAKKRTPSSTPQGKNFTTKSGQIMQIFYKEPSNEIDFYYGILSQQLKLGFVAETWGNGQGGLEDPECKIGYQSLSNTLINLPNQIGSYSYTKDHSKYAISLNSQQPYVCLADFNRQISQHRRGGTAICFINQQTWKSFDSLLAQRQSCTSHD